MFTKILTLYLFAGIIFLSIVFVYSLHRGKYGSAKALGLLSLAIDIYLLGYLLEINSSSLNEIMFWNRVEYIGIPFFPALWLITSMFYTGRIKGLREWKLALVFIIPVLTFIIRITNKYHNIYYTKIELKEFWGTQLVFLTKGPWYSIHTLYVLVCLVLCTIFYYQHYIKSSSRERIQFRLFLLATLIPYIALVLQTVSFANIGIDYTALVLPPCILLVNIALTKYNFLEIKLMARERVFEDSQEGLIILNRDLDVMDFNPASIRLFNWMNAALKRGRLDTQLENHTGVVECVKKRKEGTFEFMIDGKKRFMSVTPKEIRNKKEVIGILLNMEDVTEREIANRKLLEMAHFDELSGLYNRRYFVEQAQAAIERAERYDGKLAVIILDIDDFKMINDEHGHGCGDGAIRAVSDLLKSSFRGTDIIGRLGGEEFYVVMLNADSTEAYDKAEASRTKIEQMDYVHNGQKISVTVSLGIAELEDPHQTLEELISCADDALYKSKYNGKNQTTIYNKFE